jgi:hypothetical protein
MSKADKSSPATGSATPSLEKRESLADPKNSDKHLSYEEKLALLE